jgi:hypothetical protein
MNDHTETIRTTTGATSSSDIHRLKSFSYAGLQLITKGAPSRRSKDKRPKRRSGSELRTERLTKYPVRMQDMNNGNLVEGSAPGLAASCLPTLSEGPTLVKSHSPGSRYMGRITVVFIRHVGGSCGSIQHMAEKAVAGGG